MDLAHLDQLVHALLNYFLYPFITLLMCLLSVFVVLGNLLVVTAIWHENQLHSVTNYLIASLAAADCLVGALVMPFSIISEMVVGSWTFGPVLCDLWHSLDVLASTASIMNLCAISLDRYLAITNPICYPTKMTPKRVALLIVSLWTCSSLISFPAILWWRAVGNGPLQQVEMPERDWPADSSGASNLSSMIENNQQMISPHEELNHRSGPDSRSSDEKRLQVAPLPHPSSSSLQTNGPSQHEPRSPPDEARYKCPFTDDTYYLLFSSFVSFYGPLCVMLYAYICIYRAAVQQTRFLKYGSKQVSVSHAGGGFSETSGAAAAGGHKKSKRLRHASERSQPANCDNHEQHFVLRVHRGGGANNLVKLDSAASKRAKGQHQHQHKHKQQQQQQQQASPTDEDGDDEDEEESEPTGAARRNEQVASSSLDRTSTLSESLVESGNLRTGAADGHLPSPDSGARPHANSACRPPRSNLMLSQRDKLRVESQRFDPPSNSSSSSSPNAAKPGLNAESKTSDRLATASSGHRPKLATQSATTSRKLFMASSSTSSSGSSSCDANKLANMISAAPPPPAGRQMDVSHHFRLVKALRANPQVPPQLPASLVPLIMMNSDTSTDSSIVTVVTRPIGDTNLSEAASSERPGSTGEGPAAGEQTVAGRVGGDSAGETDARSALQVTINLGFEEENSSRRDTAERQSQGSVANAAAMGKGQILHYNSDKLIQSIVDLSNIHYIDCAAPIRDEGALEKSNQSDAAQRSDEPTADPKSADELAAAAAAANGPESSRLLSSNGGATTRVVTHSKQVVEVVGGGAGRQQRSVGKKLTKLAKERKAAKTLGIVVGVFILCWLPFFVVNILVALCGLKCIYKPDILFSIVTWLGWLNSAMNPVIYACWSRDFRRAFRRVLCTWVEFLCWDGARLARKLKLKKGPNYSSSSAQRSCASVEGNAGGGGGGGGGSQSQSSVAAATSRAAVLQTNSSNNSHKVLLVD